MRAADADILIVPGLSNSGPEHWQSRWEKKLSTARRVMQRDWGRPSRAEWEEAIAREITTCARPVVVIAHSLGVIAFLHAAQRVGKSVAGAFLVAPPSAQILREMPQLDPAFLPVPRAPLRASLRRILAQRSSTPAPSGISMSKAATAPGPKARSPSRISLRSFKRCGRGCADFCRSLRCLR
jgi:predicted alpha/beta hydrolase family esterase